jgi:hypothetical protein
MVCDVPAIDDDAMVCEGTDGVDTYTLEFDR